MPRGDSSRRSPSDAAPLAAAAHEEICACTTLVVPLTSHTNQFR